MTQEAKSALYTPRSFFLTGSFAFDVVIPDELNNLTGGTAPIPGLIGARIQLERGLFEPNWTHWVEFDYFTGSSSASGDSGEFSQSLNYMAVLPLGLTYWFARTAYIDFGFALGGGVALSPKYTLSTPQGTSTYTGKLGPVGVGRIESRFWFGNYFAATIAAGLHLYSSKLDGPGGTSAHAALSGLSIIAGATFAFGGVKGNGRSYVEVIHDRPDSKTPPRSTGRNAGKTSKPGTTSVKAQPQ